MSEFIDNKNILITYITENNSEKITYKDMKILTYIDNLTRILIFCGYNITTEYYINNKEVDNNIIPIIKEKLEKNRIYFNKYITNKDIEQFTEKTLNKLKYSPACFINNNEIILKVSEYGSFDNITLISNDGNYTNTSMIITYLEKKSEEQYAKMYISLNKANVNSILKALDLINPEINIDKIYLGTTEEVFEPIKQLNIDINELRYIMATNNKQNQLKWTKLNNTYLEITNIINKNKYKFDEIDKITTYQNNHTYNILNRINNFQNIVEEALKEKDPEILIDYLNGLIELYEQYEVVENEITKEQLSLITLLKKVINKTMDLIGIIPE